MARIIYMGTPDYARRILAQIIAPGDQFLVVTKPDMPTGRHRRLTASPVAEWAWDRQLEVLKPERLTEVQDVLERFQADYVLTAAFGRILRTWLLNLPRWGSYNLHASLLPRWRGANPIAWAIRAGDAQTGVTLMRMDQGIDTGPIVAQTAIPIALRDTTATLTDKLADLGAGLWNRVLAEHAGRELPSTPQSSDGASLAPKFGKDEGHLTFHVPAAAVDAWIRAVTPDPGAYVTCQGQRIKVLEAAPLGEEPGARVGRAVLRDGGWVVDCASGRIFVALIQPAGRRAMSPADYVRGLHAGELEWHLE